MTREAATGGAGRPRVLILTGCYPPGFRGGGPVRSMANLVEALSPEFDFRVVALDRDRAEDPAYPGVLSDRWQDRDGASVLYLPTSAVSLKRLLREVAATNPDVIYLNGFFDPMFTLRLLLARRLGRLDSPVVLAPRGDCSPGALEVKPMKKAIFVRLSRWCGLYSNLTWHASSELEREDILRVVGAVANDRIHVVTNLTDEAPAAPLTRGNGRSQGALRLCFLSRISPKKNLDFALRVLADVTVPVEFTILGPVEDAAYWATCQELMGRLPGHIRAHHAGEVLPADVRRTLSGQDLFFLPTRGENFGHVIYEALSAGVPVLISDRTPWTGLEAAGAGWNLPLEAPLEFARAIEAASRLLPAQRDAMAIRAHALANEQTRRSATIEGTRTLLRRAVAP
jgi:glycosyltransferase involved in cell wall biosynthesis